MNIILMKNKSNYTPLSSAGSSIIATVNEFFFLNLVVNIYDGTSSHPSPSSFFDVAVLFFIANREDKRMRGLWTRWRRAGIDASETCLQLGWTSIILSGKERIRSVEIWASVAKNVEYYCFYKLWVNHLGLGGISIRLQTFKNVLVYLIS